MSNSDLTAQWLEKCNHFEKMVVLNAVDVTGVDKEHFYTGRRFPIVVRTRALIARVLRDSHYTMKHIAGVLNITPEMAANYCTAPHAALIFLHASAAKLNTGNCQDLLSFRSLRSAE